MMPPDLDSLAISSMGDTQASSNTVAEEDTLEREGSEVDEPDEGDSTPPLVHPDPSRMISCVRAPCLKRSLGLVDSLGDTLSPPLSSSPTNSASPATGSFSAIQTLCAPVARRQVHFDAAPPESCVTHSGDLYDRRPIECTQGGSQLDLSLPPRGTCSLSTDEADDEACENEEEDEECKQERLKGFARWARLKNGESGVNGITAVKGCGSARNKGSGEGGEQFSDACSLPVHGIRSFGALAGSSGLADTDRRGEADEATTSVCNEPISAAAAAGASNASCEQDSDSEERHEAFRKAVLAALSKDPNATPMPSPSVRPRWECITSYFEPGSETEMQETTEQAEGPGEHPTAPRMPLSKEQEACKVVKWTKDQASDESDVPLAPVDKPVFGLTLPPHKVSPSPSIEGGSCGQTNPSSSPMSSRCSSSDAWSSSCGGGPWSGSEQDAFDHAFAKGVPATVSPPTPPVTSTASACIKAAPPKALSPSPPLAILPREEEARAGEFQGIEGDGDHMEMYHEQAPSSSSSGGGAGWMSSCCTSPELQATDVEQSLTGEATGKETPLGKGEATSTAMRHFHPFELSPYHHGTHRRSSVDVMAGSQSLGSLSHRMEIQEPASSTTSGESSPRMWSADEGGKDPAYRPSCLFRCGSKKTRKGRRTASGDGREERQPSEANRPSLSPRSKSMSSASSVKRASLLKKGSAFHDDLDDEGALGGF